VRFNLLGLLDLVVAVSLAVVLGLPGLVAVTPSTEALRLLPLALILTVAVPLAIALHIVSLYRLRTAIRPEEDRAVRVRAAS
jgi:predicted RND superfamily exporter protein